MLNDIPNGDTLASPCLPGCGEKLNDSMGPHAEMSMINSI